MVLARSLSAAGAVTVTVCSVDQLAVVNSNEDGNTSNPPNWDGVIVTSTVGCVASFTL